MINLANKNADNIIYQSNTDA